MRHQATPKPKVTGSNPVGDTHLATSFATTLEHDPMRFAFGLLATLVLLCAGSNLGAADQPNVVIFYADDLGWGETGCQGAKDIPTPHIDSLAANGIRFTQGYVAATYCSPSRAGLMTGRY